MSEVRDILNAAADLLEKPGAWTQGYYANRDDGGHTDALSDDAVCWCSLGAIARVAGAYPESDRGGPAFEAADVLEKVVGSYVADFNDKTGRTQAEVVAAFRKAAEEA